VGSSAFEQLSGAGASMKLTVQLVGHGFSCGEVLRHDGSAWVRAIADTGCNAEALAVVESTTADAFTIVFAGAINTNCMGLLNGTTYFLSTTVAGALVAEAPTATGSIKKCMLVTTTSTEGVVVNYIGAVNGIDLGNMVELSEISPVGMVVPFGGADETVVPTGWLICKGQQFSELDYPRLATLLGSNFGPVEGVMHRLPDLRGKSPVGVNVDSSLYSTRNVGEVGGEEKHFLTVGEMPSHTHAARYEAYIDEMANDNNRHLTIDGKAYGPIADQPCFSSGCSLNTCSQMTTHGPMITNDWAHYGNDNNGDDNDLGRAYKTSIVDPEGGGAAHNNMHPYLAVNYIIRAQATANASFIDVNLSNLADVDISQNTYNGVSGASSCVKLTCNTPHHGDTLVYDTNIDKWKSTFRSNDNYLINGNLDIWQRGTQNTDAGGYSDVGYGGQTWLADRWGFYRVGPGRFSMEQSTDVPASSNITNQSLGAGCKYSLKVTCTTPDANATGWTYSGLQYYMEGPDFRPLFMCGAMTLTFWVKASTSGEYVVSFRNEEWTRSYVAPYIITSPDTWQKIRITLPTPLWEPNLWNFQQRHPTSDTAGGGKGEGLKIWFSNHVGDTIKTPRSLVNQWTASNTVGVAGMVNNADTVGKTFQIAQIKLEEGTVDTPFSCLPFDVEMYRCKRYFEKSYDAHIPPGTLTNQGIRTQDDWIIQPTAHFDNPFEVEKSRTPEIAIFNPMTGMRDWYRMIHLEGNNQGADMHHHVKQVWYSTKGIRAITRFREETTMVTGYKNKIAFHYVASAELGGADGSS
jgi:microcystin-dependent protein